MTKMILRRLLTIGVTALVLCSTTLLGAVAGGGAVYWAVRDRLNSPGVPAAQVNQPAPIPQQSIQVDIHTAVEDAVAKVSPAVVTVVNTFQLQPVTDMFGFP